MSDRAETAADVDPYDFAPGDHVVLTPTSVMVVTAVGPRRLVTTPGRETTRVSGTAVLKGASPFETVQENPEEIVYGLSFAAEPSPEPFILVSVERNAETGLRAMATAPQADAFLRALAESVRSPSTAIQNQEDAWSLVNRAGNDLTELARVFPLLDAEDSLSGPTRRQLRSFFIEEVGMAKGLTSEQAEAMVDAAIEGSHASTERRGSSE